MALYRLLLRLQVTPLRVVGILALASLAVLLGALARGDDRSAARDHRDRARLRTRHRRPARDGVARDVERWRSRRGSAARLPLAEAGAALAASGGRSPRDRHDRRAARRSAARRDRDRRRHLAADRCAPARLRARHPRLRGGLRRGRALAASRALVVPPLHPRLGERPRAGRRRRGPALDRELRPVARRARGRREHLLRRSAHRSCRSSSRSSSVPPGSRSR